MKFALWSILAILLLATLFGAACNRATYSADDKSKLHVGIVFDIGGKDDRSFNAAAFAGVKCAETGNWPDGKPCGKQALNVIVQDIESRFRSEEHTSELQSRLHLVCRL